MPICPGGTGSGSPTSGKALAGLSSWRATSATAGRAGSITNCRVRWVAMRCTPAVFATAWTNSGVKKTVSPAAVELAVRTYKSAGSTTSSHWVMESRKLATITVSATARLSDATTPLTATLALSRTRRARSTASRGSSCCCTHGLTRSSSNAISHGSAVMPPTSSSATDTYAARGISKMAGTLASNTPAAIKKILIQCFSLRTSAAPRPLSVCAGGSFCASRAGHQPPTSAAKRPKAAYTSAAIALQCKAGATPAK